MKVPRTMVVACLDGDRLCALSAVVGGSGVHVKAWLTSPVPPGVDARDPSAVGAWLRSTLDKAGVTGSRLVLAVPRGEVVLKRLRLPVTAAAADIPSIVRLQMTRQISFAMEGTAIDYAVIDPGTPDIIPLEPVGAPAGRGSATPAPGEPAVGVDIFAGALPGERMAFLRAAADSAGLRIERIGLRAAGAAALLAGASRVRDGSVVGVAAGPASIEFVVLERGRLVFARSADFGLATPSGTEETLAHRVAVEAKRTWMSYRVGHDSAAVDAVAVLGEGGMALELSSACGEALELPAECVGLPRRFELPGSMTEPDRLVMAPLVGLLGESLLAPATLDFAHPRKPPDVGAARRQRALLAVLVAVAASGTGITFAVNDLASLRSDERAASKKRASLAGEYDELLLEDARLRHALEWDASDADWLAHARWLSDAMPDPRTAQLDTLSGRLEADVVFAPRDPKNPRYVGGEWRASREAVLSLAGRAQARSVANALRATLVESKVYTLDSRGPDTPDRYDYVLTTARRSPLDEPEPAKGVNR